MPQSCPSCEGRLVIERFSCPRCPTVVEGEFPLPRLARLAPSDQRFLELLALTSGNLKEIGRRLGLSYPTVRRHLDELSAHVEKEIEADRARADREEEGE